MLNKIVDAILVAACLMVLVVGGVLVDRQIKLRQLFGRQAQQVKVGQTVKITGETTLVLELSPTCHFCLASEPLYRQLSALPQIRAGKVRVVVAMLAKDRQSAQAFVDRDGIPGKLIVAEATEKFPFPFVSTPTMFLVDPRGVVVDVWKGEMHGDRVQEFIAKLTP
jgi:hypothetical protein